MPEEELMNGLGLEATRGVLSVLIREKIVVETEEGYVLAKPPEAIFVRELLGLFIPVPVKEEGLDGLVVHLESALGDKSLSSLLQEKVLPFAREEAGDLAPSGRS